jgi:hypothetical protein
MSVGPPAANGTIKRTVLDGKFCACARPVQKIEPSTVPSGACSLIEFEIATQIDRGIDRTSGAFAGDRDM